MDRARRASRRRSPARMGRRRPLPADRARAHRAQGRLLELENAARPWPPAGMNRAAPARLGLPDAILGLPAPWGALEPLTSVDSRHLDLVEHEALRPRLGCLVKARRSLQMTLTEGLSCCSSRVAWLTRRLTMSKRSVHAAGTVVLLMR